jgi:hypothetical protein
MGTNNKLFLITNGHVVRNEDEGYFPNALRIYLHTDVNDLTQNDQYDIHLYSGVRQKWIEPIGMYDVVAS